MVNRPLRSVNGAAFASHRHVIVDQSETVVSTAPFPPRAARVISRRALGSGTNEGVTAMMMQTAGGPGLVSPIDFGERRKPLPRVG